ncbi:MAG: UPF0102 protein [Candidatus Hydrogenedentota bacterium]
MRFVYSLLNRIRQRFRPRRPPSLGQRGEDEAAAFLRKAGYKILHRNLILGKNEIDIIVQKADTVVFVEVKTRASDSYLSPEANVTFAKRRKLSKAGRRYMRQRDDDSLYYRYDIIAVVLPDGGTAEITHFENAFSPE